MEASQETIIEFNNNDDDDDDNKKITVTNRKVVKIKHINLFKVKLNHIDDSPQPLFCVPANSS